MPLRLGMAAAKPWFWEKLHSAAAEHAELALEFKVPANTRPALDWQAIKASPKCQFGFRDEFLKVGNSTLNGRTKDVKDAKQDKLGKSQSATVLPESNFVKPTPPPLFIAQRPDAPAPTRFRPQELGILPTHDKRPVDRQQPSWERPKNDFILNQTNLDSLGRSQSCGTLRNFRQDKVMKDTRSLLTALVKPPSSETQTALGTMQTDRVPYHMQRFGKLGDRMQIGTDAEVRHLLSGVASFQKPKKETRQDIYVASTQPGSLATSSIGSTRSSPRLASRQLF